jgi:hypothetical protein
MSANNDASLGLNALKQGRFSRARLYFKCYLFNYRSLEVSIFAYIRQYLLDALETYPLHEEMV